ncbi:MAG: hypothetical protein ACOZNI_23345 [Myxococcota bacterium]
MATDSVISRRAGALSGWSVPLVAAVLAADAAGEATFRPQDVRFYFLLFTNWMGDDRLRPGADVDPTQVRRTLEHLRDAGLAAGTAGRPPRWSLAPGGVVRLVDALTDPRAARRFEEVLLLATVAGAYSETIAARVHGGDARRVRQRLDPRAILRAERRRLADALVDMEARRDAGPALAAVARAALAEGLAPVDVAARLAVDGPPYQLHPMRPLPEVVASLPPAMARYEVERGLERRARVLFAPLADDLRAKIAILERLEG